MGRITRTPDESQLPPRFSAQSPDPSLLRTLRRVLEDDLRIEGIEESSPTDAQPSLTFETDYANITHLSAALKKHFPNGEVSLIRAPRETASKLFNIGEKLPDSIAEPLEKLIQREDAKT